MIYVICVSGLHKEVARFISDLHGNERVVAVYLPKDCSISGKIKNLSKFLFWKIISLADFRSHIIIPHVFSPWFSIMTLFCRKLSFFDDGIMYYSSSSMVNNIRCNLYAFISRRVNKFVKYSSLDSMRYIDYLKKARGEFFFCFYPELIGDIGKKKVKIEIKASDLLGRVLLKGAVYLDTTEEIINTIGARKVLNYLDDLSKKEGLLLFKEHPRHRSPVSTALRRTAWAKEIDYDYEDFIRDYEVNVLVSVYSSALITTKQISPQVRLLCLTNTKLRRRFSSARELHEVLGVEYIDIE